MNPNLSKSRRPDEFPVLLKPALDAMKIALKVADVDPRRTVSKDALTRFSQLGLMVFHYLISLIWKRVFGWLVVRTVVS